MHKLSLVILLFILAILITLYAFMEREQEFKKHSQIRNYTVYVKSNESSLVNEIVYVDQNYEYYVPNHQYIIKSFNYTYSLKDALLKELVTIQEVIKIIPEIIRKPINYYQVGTIDNYTIYKSNESDEYCSPVIDYFYMDEQNEYYFECQISQKYIIQSHLHSFTLTEALEQNKITIDQLLYTIPTIRFTTIRYNILGKIENYSVVQTYCMYEIKDEIEIFHETKDYIYFFPTYRSKFYKIKTEDGIMSIQDALTQELVTMEELKPIIPYIYERKV